MLVQEKNVVPLINQGTTAEAVAQIQFHPIKIELTPLYTFLAWSNKSSPNRFRPWIQVEHYKKRSKRRSNPTMIRQNTHRKSQKTECLMSDRTQMSTYSNISYRACYESFNVLFMSL